MADSVTKDLVLGFCRANFPGCHMEITPYLLACIVLSLSVQIAHILPEDSTVQGDVLKGLVQYAMQHFIPNRRADIKFDNVLASMLDRHSDTYVVDTCFRLGMAKQDKELAKFVGNYVCEYTELRKDAIIEQRAEKTKSEQEDIVMN